MKKYLLLSLALSSFSYGSSYIPLEISQNDFFVPSSITQKTNLNFVDGRFQLNIGDEIKTIKSYNIRGLGNNKITREGLEKFLEAGYLQINTLKNENGEQEYGLTFNTKCLGGGWRKFRKKIQSAIDRLVPGRQEHIYRKNLRCQIEGQNRTINQFEKEKRDVVAIKQEAIKNKEKLIQEINNQIDKIETDIKSLDSQISSDTLESLQIELNKFNLEINTKI
jgi:hypothetical protein